MRFHQKIMPWNYKLNSIFPLFVILFSYCCVGKETACIVVYKVAHVAFLGVCPWTLDPFIHRNISFWLGQWFSLFTISCDMPGINEKGATSDVCHNCVCERVCGWAFTKENRYMLTSISYILKIDIPLPVIA